MRSASAIDDVIRKAKAPYKFEIITVSCRVMKGGLRMWEVRKQKVQKQDTLEMVEVVCGQVLIFSPCPVSVQGYP